MKDRLLVVSALAVAIVALLYGSRLPSQAQASVHYGQVGWSCADGYSDFSGKRVVNVLAVSTSVCSSGYRVFYQGL